MGHHSEVIRGFDRGVAINPYVRAGHVIGAQAICLVNVTVTVKQDSFFNFFETIDAEDEHEDESKPKKKDDDSDDQERDFGEKMDADLELGNCFKDDLIPLGLEYYLGVIEQESDDEDMDGMGDSDEDEKPKKASKKNSKSSGSEAGAAGGEGEQKQECKQQ